RERLRHPRERVEPGVTARGVREGTRAEVDAREARLLGTVHDARLAVKGAGGGAPFGDRRVLGEQERRPTRRGRGEGIGRRGPGELREELAVDSGREQLEGVVPSVAELEGSDEAPVLGREASERTVERERIDGEHGSMRSFYNASPAATVTRTPRLVSALGTLAHSGEKVWHAKPAQRVNVPWAKCAWPSDGPTRTHELRATSSPMATRAAAATSTVSRTTPPRACVPARREPSPRASSA